MKMLVALMIVAGVALWAQTVGFQEMRLKDVTYEELLEYPAEGRVILAGRVEKARFVLPGSRSERVIIDVKVIVGTAGLSGESLQLTRYAHGDSGVKIYSTYLFAAHIGEWAPSWSLVEAVPLEGVDAAAVVKAVNEELLRRSHH
jgi:hypothetical protein